MNKANNALFLFTLACYGITFAHDSKDSDIDIFSHHNIFQTFNNNVGMKKSIEVKDMGEKIEISIKVPDVENSDSIKAYASKGQLKIIVPQKSTITKIVIDQNSIKKISKQQMEEKHQSKTMQRFSFSASKQTEFENLPSSVDITERSVEYKENDVLLITLNKAQGPKTAKPQPRVIPVINK